MFNCPHCNQPIDISPSPRPPGTSWQTVVYDKSNVSLGCGSLIAIAIIVFMCSGLGSRGTSELRTDVRALNQKVDDLQGMIRDLQATAPTEAAASDASTPDIGGGDEADPQG